MTQSNQTDSTHSSTESKNASSTTRRNVLRATTGITTVAVGVGALTGRAAAHFPADLEVDIKPDSDENSINPNGRGVIPVAVRQTDEFDPTSEDLGYRFGAPDVVEDGGGARPVHGGHIEDVDGDGRDDLILHFPTAETGFDGGDSEGRLEWERTEDGHHGLSGTDEVTIVGRNA